ncbi:Glycosyltransferase-like protein LARGE2 [Galdieria sulphuraria]|nr:Glycosyltransferase-like protein LARGE2 [Galdieria sulphuraria]
MNSKFFTLVSIVTVLWNLITCIILLERIYLGAERDLLQLQRALVRVRSSKTPKTPLWSRKYQIPLKMGQGWYGWPPRCIKLSHLEPTSVQLYIRILDEKFVSSCQPNAAPRNLSCFNCGFEFLKFDLPWQGNYKVIVKGTTKSDTCCLIFSTPGDNNNWINDPSFQVFGTPLLRHWLGLSSTRTLKYWMPLYSNGYDVDCVLNHSCGLLLGRLQSSFGDPQSFGKSDLFGVLQPIWIANNLRADINFLCIEMNVQSLSNVRSLNCFMVIYGTTSQMRRQNFVLDLVCLRDYSKLVLQLKVDRSDPFLYLALVKNASSDDAVKVTNIRIQPKQSLVANVSENVWRAPCLMNDYTNDIFTISRWRKPNKSELTLAIPLSMHRMFILKELLKFYKTGPVVAVIAIQSEQEKKELLEYLSIIPNNMRMNVEFVIVLISPWKDRFPINQLRNIALKYTTTDFVCVLDVDTFPVSSAFTAFPQIMEKEPELLPMNRKRCLVVTNWIASDSEQLVYPSVEDLKSKYLKTWFPYCEASQSPISFRRWLYDNNSYFVSFRPNFEPYCIMRTRDFILFDERFHGYGFNKVSWALEATLQGVEFLVDNRFFVLHKDHPTQLVENSLQYCMNWILYYAFVNEKLFETTQ